MQTTAAYQSLREATTAMLRSMPDDVGERNVPACPEWNVRDVVAHLGGVVTDALAGNLDGAGTDPWTEAQVAARRNRSLAQVLDEWNEQAPVLEGVLGPDGAPAQLIFDAATHEQDLRSAVDRPAADPEVLAVAMTFVADSFPAATAHLGLPELRVEPTDGGTPFVAGSGEPAGVLRGTLLDLLRSFTGRRTADQIRSLDWQGDPAVWLPAFTWGPFRLPEAPVEPGPASPA